MERESLSRSISLFEHDLFGKPVSTFPDHALFVCDEPATAKHRINVQMSRSGLSVAAPPPKQVDVRTSSAGADGRGLVYGIKWLNLPRGLATSKGACFDRAFALVFALAW
jgi:hypothetical protein